MDRVLEASNSLTKCFEAASFGLPLPSSKVVAVVEGLRLGFDFEEDLGGREKDSFMVSFPPLIFQRETMIRLLLAMFNSFDSLIV